MDPPSLGFVPPTPVRYETITASPSSIATSRTAVSSLPHSRFSGIEQERTSTETTIFSIYSMYGDDQSNRGSWSATPDRKSKDASTIVPTVNLTLPQNSLFKPNGHAPIDPAYRDRNMHKSSPSVTRTRVDIAEVMIATNGANTVHRNSRSSHSASRPTSSLLHPDLSEDRRASTSQAYSAVDLTPSTSAAGPSRSRQSSYSQKPRHSPANSLTRQSDSSRPSSAHAHATPPQGPSRTLSPHSSPPLKHPVNSSALSSKVSLVPSEGEDMDAFHVRNTYAQLEMTGVKGDGYEEGVERTRARVGNSRISQQNAEAAVGDGSEKTRDLNPKEVQVLASLDRYGFFTIPSHDRLILLSSPPLMKRLSISSAGPPTAGPNATSLDMLPQVPLPIKESTRIAKWTRMLLPSLRDQGGNIETWTIKPSKERKLRERTYKGIPDRWRGAVWELLMAQFSRKGLRNLGDEYREALEKPSSYDIQIDLDVPRTISGHIMFRTRYGAGQRSLFHVLHCFSLKCGTCGYVQGMGPIAATLLCYFEPERVYAALVRLHDAYSMHTIFNPGFPGLLEAIYVQERITEQKMPDVYAAFKKHMISTTSYATKWYITLFANSVPFQTQLRLWDAFLLEGHDVFVAVAVAIVWVYRDQITSSSANFETVLSLLSSFFVPEDENVLLGWIETMLGDKKLRASMRQWREDWKGLVKSGKDGTALL